MNANPAVEIRYAYNFRPTPHRPARPHLHPKLRRFLFLGSGTGDADTDADAFHRLMRELISDRPRPPTRRVSPSDGTDDDGMVVADRLEIVVLALGLVFLVLLLGFILWSTVVRCAGPKRRVPESEKKADDVRPRTIGDVASGSGGGAAVAPPFARRGSIVSALVDEDGMRKRANSVLKIPAVEEAREDLAST